MLFITGAVLISGIIPAAVDRITKKTKAQCTPEMMRIELHRLAGWN